MGVDCTRHFTSASNRLNDAIKVLDSLDAGIFTTTLAAPIPFGNVATLLKIYDGLIADVDVGISALDGKDISDVDSVKAHLRSLKICSYKNPVCRALAEVMEAGRASCLAAFQELRNVLAGQQGALAPMFLFAPVSFIIAAAVAGGAKAKAMQAGKAARLLFDTAGLSCSVDTGQLDQGLTLDASPEDAWVALWPRTGTSSFTEMKEKTAGATSGGFLGVPVKMPKGWPPVSVPATCTTYAVESWQVSARVELGGIDASMEPLAFKWTLNGNQPSKVENDGRVAFFETPSGPAATLRVEVATATGFVMAAEKQVSVPREHEKCVIVDQRGLKNLLSDIIASFGGG